MLEFLVSENKSLFLLNISLCNGYYLNNHIHLTALLYDHGKKEGDKDKEF